MSDEGKNIGAASSEERSEYRWIRASRFLVGLAVIACFVVIPTPGRASIFTSLIGLVEGVATTGGHINANVAGMQQYNVTYVTPLSQLSSITKWLGAAENSYGRWFGSVLNVKIASARLGSTVSLEDALRAGLTGEHGGSISSAYPQAYGVRPPAGSVSAGLATSMDMDDSEALEGMALAAQSDSASMQVISAAKGFETAAANNAPGMGDALVAQALAMQLQSEGMRQHVLASLLRQEATRLATESQVTKAAAANHTNAMQKLFGGGDR